ncbi:beta strand repeat-containing protein [Winogradskyella psychrotolerans]|uniref:beta strand repeat-containing protein n=1 Tax=Winogradskyella psychrotolerans TaxID=1344585 RepID=UPI001C07A9B6|nr:T9SS type A sorting domain-containing protein [Winogradskyella psychrotolerans]MBU2927593.1 T9SS type A sorting domain-containing protein [Winogradskyella psychrotolerans]
MKHIYLLLITLFIGSIGYSQTTVSYDFSDGGAESGLNESSPGITVDSNIGFGSFKNSGTSNPGIYSNQLRLYQNDTQGGSIKIYANNGVTITDVTIYASSRTGPAEYTVDGGSATAITISGGAYTMSSLGGISTIELTQKDSNSSNRIYIDSFDVTYSSPSTCTSPTSEATAFSASSITTDAATISWTRGTDGDNVIVIMKEGSAVDFSPESETSYPDNANFSSGTELGTGNYVVYNGSGTSVDVTELSSNTTYYIAIYEYNDTDTCYMSTALTDNFTTLISTTVEFNGSTASVSEGVGTYELEFTIANEDAVNDTTFDVVLTGGDGDATDIDGYTTQTVTFPGGSAADQVVILTVTDDTDLETDETLTFEIQNVSGGDNAVAGLNSTFTLTITNNDVAPPIALPYSEDFSDCGAVEWTAFDEAGGNSWTCGSDEYAMNGYGSTNVDWLISDFSIDFDAYASVNIDVTTQERYGDTTNTPGEFELLYSIDYTGGDPTTATWTAITFDPNNTASSGTLSTASVTSVDASSITGTAYLAFKYDMNFGSGAEDWRVQNIDIYEVLSSTTVEFVSSSATVGEDVGTYDLEFSISNEDATNDTTFDVVLVTGDTADIDGYTTQTVTFAAGTSTNQTVTITVTDDLIDEGDETLTFEIQNVAGGNSAAVGFASSFDLTISVSDTPIPAAGWQITSENTAFVIDFDTTVTDVNNGAFDGSGFTDTPASGQLDSDAWEATGMSDGSLSYGGSQTSGDYIKGSSTGGVSSGGFYAFDTGSSNSSLGFQATGSDFTPGTITLRAQNQTGTTVTTADLAYLIYVYNDQGRSTTFDFSYSTDDLSYTDVAASNLTSDATADGSLIWVSNSKATSITGLSIADGEYLYLRWSTADNGGSGSRDEFALDDISLSFNPIPPVTYTYNGTWSPSDPNGTATANDDIIITSGNATITANTTANSVTVNPGAAITVDDIATLNATNGLVLESTSSSFSSLILNGTITGTITYERFANAFNGSAAGGNDLITPPLSGQSWSDFLTTGTNSTDLLDNGATSPTTYAFAPFDKSASAYVNYTDATSATLDSGTGYRVATDSGANLTFTGSAADDTVIIGIENSGSSYASWNLIGNPYPSYLDMEAFLEYASIPEQRNIDIIGDATGIYGYDGTSNVWATYTLANANEVLIAPGQGFFVSSDSASSNLYFTTDMRTTGTSDDFITGRNANVLTYLKLKASTLNNSYSTDFYFNTNSSLGLDLGYDAKIWGGTAPSFALYSHLVEDNTGLPIALQSLNTTDLSDVSIPLGVNANQGEQLTFSIADSTLGSDVNVYLDDNVLNTSTLLNTGDYVITPNADLSGTGRFYLRATVTTLSTIDNNFDHLNIYTNKAAKTIVIAGQLVESTTASVYDVQGRLVVSTLLETTNRTQTIDVSQLNDGVYVVKLHNAAQNKTQKVIIR